MILSVEQVVLYVVLGGTYVQCGIMVVEERNKKDFPAIFITTTTNTSVSIEVMNLLFSMTFFKVFSFVRDVCTSDTKF